MTVKELTNLLARLNLDPEDEVVIARAETSIGFKASAPVRTVCTGFDWDRGKLLIYPDMPLVYQSSAERMKMAEDALHAVILDLDEHKGLTAWTKGKIRRYREYREKK